MSLQLLASRLQQASTALRPSESADGELRAVRERVSSAREAAANRLTDTLEQRDSKRKQPATKQSAAKPPKRAKASGPGPSTPAARLNARPAKGPAPSSSKAPSREQESEGLRIGTFIRGIASRETSARPAVHQSSAAATGGTLKFGGRAELPTVALPRPSLAMPSFSITGFKWPLRLLALLVALLVIGFLAVRFTAISAVSHVSVSGLQGPDAAEIEKKIIAAAKGQSTLGFKKGKLTAAAGPSADIGAIDVQTEFPNRVSLQIVQVRGVAVTSDGAVVSATGRVIEDWPQAGLPVISSSQVSRGSLSTWQAELSARIAGAAPKPLLPRISRIDVGTVVRIKNGPSLYFRDGTRINAKWAAAAAVLADASSRGASWIDLRIPSQPVAGTGTPPQLPKQSVKAAKISDDAVAEASAERVRAMIPKPAPPAQAATTSTAASTGTTATAPSATTGTQNTSGASQQQAQSGQVSSSGVSSGSVSGESSTAQNRSSNSAPTPETSSSASTSGVGEATSSP